MGSSVDMYVQVKRIVDDLAKAIGGFDPAGADKSTRALLHASTAPAVVLIMALVNKRLTINGVQVPVLTTADLLAARDVAYADTAWPTVVEPDTSTPS